LSLEATVSDGIISAIREGGGAHVLQITAPISPGSSGGALLNLQGEVIGVTSFTTKSGQHLNFAYPSEYLKELLLSKRLRPLSEIGAGRLGAPGASTEVLDSAVIMGVLGRPLIDPAVQKLLRELNGGEDPKTRGARQLSGWWRPGRLCL